jgi:hypothetical protein
MKTYNILLLCGSTVLERTLYASHNEGFLTLPIHLEGLLWTSDQPVAKAYRRTKYGKMRTNIHALSGIRTHGLSVEGIRPTPQMRGHSDRLYYPPVSFNSRPLVAMSPSGSRNQQSVTGQISEPVPSTSVLQKPFF